MSGWKLHQIPEPSIEKDSDTVLRKIDLVPGPNSVGRGRTNDIRLMDRMVSGAHAIIEVTLVDGSSNVTVMDLASKNGTQVRGVKIPQSERVHADSGSYIRMGDTHFILKYYPV